MNKNASRFIAPDCPDARVPIRGAGALSTGPASQLRVTARELEILALVARGFGNRNIAAALNLTENTIKTHLQICFRKLGASNRAEAIAVALTRGLLSWNPRLRRRA